MKKSGMTPALFLTACFLVGLPLACSKTYTVAPLSTPAAPVIPTPTNTPIPTATPTPGVTPNPNGPLIEAFFFDFNLSGGFPFNAAVYVEDNSGNPITTAAVTLITPGASIPLTFMGVNASGPPTGSGIANITGGEYVNTFTYVGGQNCSIEVVISGVAYTANFSTTQASGSIAKGSSGVTCTWTGGNEDFALVEGADNFQDGPSPPVSSPLILPASDFPSDPAGAGNDYVILYLLQAVQPAFPGCNASSVVATTYVTDVTY